MGRPKKNPAKCECWYNMHTKKRVRCEMHQAVRTGPKRPRYFPVPPQVILEIGKGITDPLGRALFFLTYLTGARIGEAMEFQPAFMVVTDSFYRIEMKVEKKRNGGMNMRTVPIPRGEKAKCFENEMMDDVIQFLRGKSALSQPFAKWKRMSMYIMRAAELTVNARVKNEAGIWVNRQITKKLHPHYLRHCRAKHLVDYYNFSDTKLRVFFEWSDTKMAATYANAVELEASF